MTRQEALIHLGLPIDSNLDAMELEEVFDEKVFELKKYCITHAVVPQLFDKRLATLKLLNEAGKKLNLDMLDISCVPSIITISGATFGDRLNNFNKHLTSLKTQILAAPSITYLFDRIVELMNLHREFRFVFWDDLGSHILPFEDETVQAHKLSYLMDSMDLYYALKDTGLDQLEPMADSKDMIQKKWPTNLPAIKLLIAEYKRVKQLFA